MSNAFQRFMVSYRSGDVVFNEGDVGSTMYIVQSGRVHLFRRVDDERCSLGVMEKGDFFGEMSILEGLPRTQAAEVMDDAELIEINSTVFDKMIRGNIEIAIRMLRKLSLRLRETERQIADGHTGNGARPSMTTATASNGSASKAPPVSGVGGRLETSAGDASFAVLDGETLLGRFDPVTGSKPDIDLSDVDLKRSVSRRHATLRRLEDGICTVAEEVGALNGTWINDDKLVPGQAHPIADGDTVRLGTVSLVFHT